MMRTGLFAEIQHTFKKGSMVTRLIYLNLMVFLVVKLVDVVLFLSGADTSLNALVTNMAVPADISQLAHKPWTLITYMFLHQQFLHILFNLLWLFWFGKIFTEYLSNRQLLNVYLLGGICGALLYIAAFNVFPVFASVIPVSVAMGASAGVYAIVVATAVYVPNYTVYLLFLGPVKLKYIALFSILLDVVQLTEGNAGGHIAHIGGAAFGAVFALQVRNGLDISHWLSQLFNWLGQLLKPRKKMKVAYRRGETDIDYNARKKEEQKEIDVILEKIAKSGYESLSKAEKELLFRQSRKN